MAAVERPFASTYLELITLAEDRSPDWFLSTSTYGQLESLGPSLPQLKAQLPRSETGSGNETSVELEIKLIKPPYKFTTKLVASGASTLSKVKLELISLVDLLLAAGITPNDIKLLVKGKVIPDTALVATLGEGKVLFMAMVSAPKSKETTPMEVDSAADPSDPSDPSEHSIDDLGIPAATWDKIGKILVADLGEARGATELERLKKI